MRITKRQGYGVPVGDFEGQVHLKAQVVVILTVFAVAKVGKDAWQMEVRVPFARLPLDGPSKDWTFHLARNRRVASQHLTSLKSVVCIRK